MTDKPSKRASKSPTGKTSELPGQAFTPHVANIDYGELDSLIGYAIRRAQIMIYEDFERRLGPLEITPQRYAALVIIGRNPGLNQSELGAILGVARSGAMVVVNNLERMGLVSRVRPPGDRRSYGIVLTPNGVSAMQDINREVTAHDQYMAGDLSEAERGELLKLLSRLRRPREA